jgi:hypothetical protein
METLETVGKLVSNRITNDLEQVNELIRVSRDPIGYSVYLYFLLKNKIRSVEVDNLIDWMNSWVENILIQRNFSRFIDRELASSFFAFFSLKAFGRLRINVKVENLEELFSEYIEDEHFFSNFMLSTIIALSLADFKDKIKEYPSLLGWIKTQIDEKNVFNDAKNLVFASILFERLGIKNYIKKAFDYCYERLLENTIPYYDELYYAYVMWKFRSLKEKSEDLQKIREFTGESIENAKISMHKEEDESVKEIYGIDMKKGASKISVSKIYLGVFIDMQNDFSEKTVKVSPEELARKDIPRWVSLGSLISAIIFVSGVGITWLAFRLKPLIKSLSMTDPFLTGVAQFAVNGLLFVLAVFLFSTSLSLFWDIVSERICIPNVIKNNLTSRLKRYVWLEVALPLVFGLLQIFF